MPQRTAKRYDDEVRGKDVGLRLLLLAAVILAEREHPPEKTKTKKNEQASNAKEERRAAKLLEALRRVKPDGYRAPSTFSLLELETLCKA